MVETAPQVFIPQFRPAEDKGWWSKLLGQVIRGEGLEKLQERREMAAIAQAESMTERKTVNGLGQLKAVIPLKTYLRWNEAVPGCWGADATDFRREFYRDNPDVIAARPTKKHY
jgi:hypothetical protein